MWKRSFCPPTSKSDREPVWHHLLPLGWMVDHYEGLGRICQVFNFCFLKLRFCCSVHSVQQCYNNNVQPAGVTFMVHWVCHVNKWQDNVAAEITFRARCVINAKKTSITTLCVKVRCCRCSQITTLKWSLLTQQLLPAIKFRSK